IFLSSLSFTFLPKRDSAVLVWMSPPVWKILFIVGSPERAAAILSSICDWSASTKVHPGGAVMIDRIFLFLGTCWRLGSAHEVLPVTATWSLNVGCILSPTKNPVQELMKVFILASSLYFRIRGMDSCFPCSLFRMSLEVEGCPVLVFSRGSNPKSPKR